MFHIHALEAGICLEGERTSPRSTLFKNEGPETGQIYDKLIKKEIKKYLVLLI